MITPLRRFFGLIGWRFDSHASFMKSFEGLSVEELKQCPPIVVYNALDMISSHIFKEARLKNAYNRTPETGAIAIDESGFAKEIALAKNLCAAHDFSDQLYGQTMIAVMQTAQWLAENRPRILTSNNEDDLKAFLGEMLSVQAKAFEFDGLGFDVPDIRIVHSTKSKNLGWVYLSDIRRDDYKTPEIYINRGVYDKEHKDDIFMTAFHEGMHSLFSQMARRLHTGHLTKESDFYKDAVCLATKYDCGYAANTMIRSIYYADPEEHLVHQAHKEFIALSRSMPAAIGPLILHEPIRKPY